MRYDIRNIMGIQQPVNVHTVTTAYGWLGKLLTFLIQTEVERLLWAGWTPSV